MRYVITGGTGLIGRRLSQSLLQDGHDVVVLTRSPEKRDPNVLAGARLVGWDARTAEGWGHEVDGADAVVNFAGENIGGDSFPPDRWTAAKKRRIVESRANAGSAVCEAVAAAMVKPRLVVQASAVGYYGPHGDEVLDETSPPGDDFLARVCVDWEASTAPVEELGVTRVVTRTGLILAEKDAPFAMVLLPFKLFVGGPFGSGRQYWSWIHLDDEIRALRFLLAAADARGPFNLTAPNPHTNREIARELGRVMKRPSFFGVPAFATRLIAGETATVVLDGQRVVPNRLLELGFEFKYPELEGALRNMLNR